MSAALACLHHALTDLLQVAPGTERIFEASAIPSQSHPTAVYHLQLLRCIVPLASLRSSRLMHLYASIMFASSQWIPCAAESAKISAQKKTESALQALRTNADDANAKLADLHRRMEEAQNEVKALLQKGQKEKAKLVLRKKKMLEKQTMGVQNVRLCCAGNNVYSWDATSLY
jgi:hypothetical protein